MPVPPTVTTSAEDPPPDPAPRGPVAPAAGQGQRAAQQASARNSVHVTVPVLGTLDLPPTEDLAYLAGMGVLAVAGVLEWPIAVTLALGHLFANSRRNKTLRDFGQALEEA